VLLSSSGGGQTAFIFEIDSKAIFF